MIKSTISKLLTLYFAVKCSILSIYLCVKCVKKNVLKENATTDHMKEM